MIEKIKETAVKFDYVLYCEWVEKALFISVFDSLDDLYTYIQAYVASFIFDQPVFTAVQLAGSDRKQFFLNIGDVVLKSL